MSRYENIYVVCPANKVTGGPDALHQMVYYLRMIGCKANISYYKENKNISICIPEPYRCYIDNYVFFEEIVDDESNAIILPEMYSFLSNRIKKAKVFIWWLSVDNNARYSFSYKAVEILKSIKNHKVYRIKNILKKKKYSFNCKNHIQLCASQYAYDYVSNSFLYTIYKCVEPISKYFLEENNKWDRKTVKEDIVLYNPSKCDEYVQKLISTCREINFVPLKGYNQKQLVSLYKKAKLYIDFGPFPGAERIPKEAVIFNVAIITGRHGASKYYQDVKIPEKYKIDETKTDILDVIHTIKKCLKDYERINEDFDEYRKMVFSLEKDFINVLESIF